MKQINLKKHKKLEFGMQKDINLWLRDKSPNWHLAMLIALQLYLNWDGKLSLITSTPYKADVMRLQRFLGQISDMARLPSNTEFHVLVGSFEDNLIQAPYADINIFGMPNKPDFSFMRHSSEVIETTCLYVKDSGTENALV